MTDVVKEIVVGFNVAILAYIIVLQVVYSGLLVVGWRAVEDYVRRRPLRDYKFVADSPLSMPVSILVPAYNEEATIVGSVQALLQSQFVEFEVVVINDGSKDRTLDLVRDAFGMVAVDRVPRSRLDTAEVRAVYASPLEPRVVMIDKANGGKADSLNAGIKYAIYPLFCAIDADTLLDPGALSRLVWEFQASPDTVAAGGIVRILNGSTMEGGRLVDVRTPKRMIENLQIIEYLRAFLGGRVGWSRTGMLLIISGAFGLFRRDIVIEAGGYDPTTVGEDAELVLRLHRLRREQGRPCRITFFPDPICWTECPNSWRVLMRQRDRWQRGLIEMIWTHRDMIFRRRYGRIGMVAMPYFILFELLGPTIEVVGTLVVILSFAFGLVSLPFVVLFATTALTYGLVLTFLVILMEERAFRRYPDWHDLRRLMWSAVVENFGYRQLLSLVRLRSWWTVRKKDTWGEMTRVGFGPPAMRAPEPAVTSEAFAASAVDPAAAAAAVAAVAAAATVADGAARVPTVL